MTYARCVCGQTQHYGSGMLPPLCQPCLKCGSIPALGPEPMIPRPHSFRFKQRVQTDAGPEVLTRCDHCLKTRVEVERDEVTLLVYDSEGRQLDVSVSRQATARAAAAVAWQQFHKGYPDCPITLRLDDGTLLEPDQTLEAAGLVNGQSVDTVRLCGVREKLLAAEEMRHGGAV